MSTVVNLPTKHGDLEFFYFSHSGQEGVVVQNRNYTSAPFVRVHSSCLFSEALNAIDCDCAAQLNASLSYVGLNGGYVIYLYQEGRGVGLNDKIEAIALEISQGLDTAEAFSQLGHRPDPRSYDAVISVLNDLSLSEIRLATNNPRKVAALEEAGIKIVERVCLSISKSEIMREYVQQKRDVLGHYGDD